MLKRLLTWAGYKPSVDYYKLLGEKTKLKGELEALHKELKDDHKVWRDKHEEAKNCKIIIFQDKKNEFRWHLKAGNNKIIAESGEGYKARQGLEKSLRKLRRIMEIVQVFEEIDEPDILEAEDLII